MGKRLSHWMIKSGLKLLAVFVKCLSIAKEKKRRKGKVMLEGGERENLSLDYILYFVY